MFRRTRLTTLLFFAFLFIPFHALSQDSDQKKQLDELVKSLPTVNATGDILLYSYNYTQKKWVKLNYRRSGGDIGIDNFDPKLIKCFYGVKSTRAIDVGIDGMMVVKLRRVFSTYNKDRKEDVKIHRNINFYSAYNECDKVASRRFTNFEGCTHLFDNCTNKVKDCKKEWEACLDVYKNKECRAGEETKSTLKGNYNSHFDRSFNPTVASITKFSWAPYKGYEILSEATKNFFTIKNDAYGEGAETVMLLKFQTSNKGSWIPFDIFQCPVDDTNLQKAKADIYIFLEEKMKFHQKTINFSRIRGF